MARFDNMFSLSIGLVFYLLLCLESGASSSSSSLAPAFLGRIPGNVFGIGRGGGLFGKNGDAKNGDAAAGDGTKFPPMSDEEVEEWLSHIPVFAITDASGACVVLRRNDTSVIDFFLAAETANATMQFLKSGVNTEEVDLRISAFSLGKVWFRFIASGDAENTTVAQVKLVGAGDESSPTNQTTSVSYRLVPNPRDLLGARMLLTMDPSDGEKLKEGKPLTAEDAQAAVQKAMTEAPKFMGENEIPVFMIPHMRMQRQPKEGEEAPAPEKMQILPMYFSLMDMMSTWQQVAAQDPSRAAVEPAINLMELHELVEKMQEESEIDFRDTILLMPPNPVAAGGQGLSAAGAAPSVTTPSQDPMTLGGGNTLGDL